MTLDIMHDEERRREIAEVEAAKRNEKIESLAEEYFNDVGTFFEFIQGIEIGEDEEAYYTLMHKHIIGDEERLRAGIGLSMKFEGYCYEKAVEEIDE